MAKKRIKADFKMDNFVTYIYYRLVKIYPEITHVQIRSVLRKYFEYCKDDLGVGTKVYMGSILGNLYLEKRFGEIKYDEENDKIINTLPVNIHETLKLWKERPELRKVRFVRYTNEHSGGYSFRLKYEKSLAKYSNKTFYDFKFSDPVRDAINKGVSEKKTDAYINKYYNE